MPAERSPPPRRAAGCGGRRLYAGRVRRDPRSLLLTALGCLAGLVVTGLVALALPAAEVQDARALEGFRQLRGDRLGRAAHEVAALCDPVPYGVFGLCILLVAIARRRWVLAAAIPVVLFASPFTTETLKPLLATPRIDEWLGDGEIAVAAWPSGHATAAMTLALLATLVTPPRLRPVVAALGALFAAGVGFSLLVLSWHWPSDVFGGFLVAGMWTCLAAAVVLAATPDREEHEITPGRAAWPVAAGVLALAATGALALAVLVKGAHSVAAYANAHTTMLAVAGAIAVLGVVLAEGLARTLGRP